MKKLGILIALVVLAGMASAQTTIFSDNMTSFPTGWTLSPTSGGWTKTSTKYYSSSYSAMGDNISPYGTNQANYMTRTVSLSGYSSASLSFYIWQYTESNYDYIYVQYSTNGGTSYTTAWSRSGSYQSWSKQTVSIPTTANRIRFYFKSDYSVQNTGVYIDDVVLTATSSSTPTLAVSMSSWSVAAAGGTSSTVNVTNSGSTSVIAYTVSDNATWLTTSAASGNTPGSFTMTAAANTTTSSRTATVTVTATTSGVSGSPKTITVTQAAATAGQNDAGTGGDAGNTIATATLVSPGSWTGCYLDATDRNDYYKFSVTSGQVIKVKITPPSSADFDLYLHNPSQTQVASSLRGAGLVDSIVYTANATGYWYARAYEYSGTGNYSLQISVSGTVTPTLAVSMSSWSVAAAGGTSSTVNVTNSGSTSVIAYTVSDNATWLTTSATSGNTPGSFTMTAAANTSTSSRTATVTVTATTSGVSGSPKTITVTQAGTGSTGAEWTIMVFMNADNNLESYGIADFLEMAAASYSSGKVNVIVQMDRSSSYVTTYDNWTSCKRFKIANGMTPVASYQISDIGEADMGSPTTLSTFATWAISNYPANKYGLIFWDHGDGWYKGEGTAVKGFSNDDSHGSVIGIANGEFASAMATIKSSLGRNLDLIGWDACLMGMWEVLDIAKNYANVAVVSEETEGADGWYYTPWLNALNTTPTTSAIDVGKAIVNGTTGMSTLSVVDLTQIATLNTYVNTFADQLMAAKAAGYSSSVSTALSNCQKFSTSYFSYHIDLSDFATKVKTQITSITALTTACNNVISQVTNAVKLYKNSSSYTNARGIAIFHNSSSSNYDTDYNNLPVAANTHWDEYLKGQTSAASYATGNDPTNTRFGRDHAPAFELAPCLPNPVRYAATLSFQLLDQAPTTLRIYNLNGQAVKTLVNGTCGAGWHDHQWDLRDDQGRKVSAGTYFFKLESGKLHDMKRLVVVK